MKNILLFIDFDFILLSVIYMLIRKKNHNRYCKNFGMTTILYAVLYLKHTFTMEIHTEVPKLHLMKFYEDVFKTKFPTLSNYVQLNKA